MTEIGKRTTELEVALADLARFARGTLEALVWAILAAPLAVFLIAVKRLEGLFWSQLFNVAHVVLSGVVAIAFLRLSRHLLINIFRGPWSHYWLAFCGAAVVGGGLEIVQLFVPGEASLKDLARDFLGAFVAIILAASFDPRFRNGSSRSRARILALRGIACGLFCASLVPFAKITVAMACRRWEFPTLANFDSRWNRPFTVTDNGASLVVETPPSGFSRARGLVGKVTFATGDMYPKLELIGPLGKWSSYKTLAFEVYSPDNLPITVTLRVHDAKHQDQYTDRFNTELTIRPGENSIALPLASIQKAPATREMDMTAIAGIAVFAHSPERDFTLYFDDFRLE